MSHTCVVLGGAGFIGSNLAHRLHANGHEVRIVDIMAEGSAAHPQNITGLEHCLAPGDVRDQGTLESVLDGADIVYNLAGQTGHRDSMERPANDLQCNALGALNVLEACRTHAPDARIVYTSTRQVYGRVDRSPVTESQTLAPPDINAVHKIAAEHYHGIYQRIHGLDSCVLRLSNVYGPRMRIVDARQTFVGIWVRKVIEGSSFEVWGGEQRRDLLYVDDAVDALIAAGSHPDAPGKTFNVAGNEAPSLIQLADLLSPDQNYQIQEMPAERTAIDVGDITLDTQAIQNALGWTAQTALPDGLRQTLEYYRAHLTTYLEDAR